MSQAVIPLPCIRDQDPRMNIDNHRLWGVYSGPGETSYREFKTVSSSNTSFQFTTPPPSPFIVVDRRVYIKYKVHIEVTRNIAAAHNAVVNSAGIFALRAFPLNSVMTTLTCTLNNTNVSINPADVLPGLWHYNSELPLANEYWSTCPTMLDQSRYYSDLAGNSNRNPLGQYYDCPQGAQMPRGAFQWSLVTNPQTPDNTAVDVTAIFEAEVTEPIFLSPWYWEQLEKSGFYGIQNMSWNFTFGDLSRMVSLDPVAMPNIRAVNVSLLPNPAMLFCYMTPKEAMSLPPEGVIYPYYDVLRYPSPPQNIPRAANAFTPTEATIVSNNIQLQSIPRRLYVFCRPLSSAQQTYATTDTFLGIKSVSVNWGNRAGLLSGASKQQLYHMSRKNGCCMSYQEYSGESFIRGIGGAVNPLGYTTAVSSGSVMCIAFDHGDIGLNSTESPGLLMTNQLQMNVVVQNYDTTADATQATLWIVVVSQGSFTIAANRSIAQIGVITRDDVLNAIIAPDQIEAHSVDKLMGGSIFGRVVSFLKKARGAYHDYVKPYVPIAEKAISAAFPAAAPAVETFSKTREALGLGVIGGAKMSKAQMKRLLKQ